VPEFQTYCYIEGIHISSPSILKRERSPLSDPYCIEGYNFQFFISSSSNFHIFLLDIYPMGVYYDGEKERRKI